MELKYRIGLIVVLLVGLAVWLHFKRPVPIHTLPFTLTKDQLRASNEALSLPNYGHGIIYKNVGGHTVVTPKVMGMPFDVGVSIAVGPSAQLYLTTEVFFYRHFELLASAGVTFPVVHPRLMGAVGYRLPWKRLDNLSLFVGGTTAKEVVAGIYFRFGSN